MKYVPVLRYRQEERKVITNHAFSMKMMPLIEIVKEKPNIKMRDSFNVIHTRDFSHINVPFIVDFPMDFPITRNTNGEVAAFLRPIQQNVQTRLTRFQQLQGIPNLIPTVSYTPGANFQNGSITNQSTVLRPLFQRLCFRLYLHNLANALLEVSAVVQAQDILLLDLEEAPHGNPGLIPSYASINQLRNSGCISAVIRSNVPATLTNLSLIDNQIVAQVDNSLLTAYTTYGFDAFGDYVGVKRDSITEGGSISPGFLFYNWQSNSFTGYRGRTRVLSEFESHIVPTLIGSPYWPAYSAQHHQQCPGCLMIQNIRNGNEPGSSQAKWKGITLSHYLYTMEESL